jgi:ketosteroid isomerase-like protein
MNDNVSVAMRLYEAFNSRDIERMRALCQPDVEWNRRTQLPDRKVYRGFGDLAEGLITRQFDEPFEELQAIASELVEAGEDVAVVLTLRGVGRASGLPWEMRSVHMLHFVDGRIAWAYDIGGQSRIPAQRRGSLSPPTPAWSGQVPATLPEQEAAAFLTGGREPKQVPGRISKLIRA